MKRKIGVLGVSFIVAIGVIVLIFAVVSLLNVR